MLIKAPLALLEVCQSLHAYTALQPTVAIPCRQPQLEPDDQGPGFHLCYDSLPALSRPAMTSLIAVSSSKASEIAQAHS